MADFSKEIDEIYSLYLDYEGNDQLTYDRDIAPKLQELLGKLTRAAQQEGAEWALAHETGWAPDLDEVAARIIAAHYE